MQADVRVNLIDRLAAIFGRPRDADFLAAELVKHVPASVSGVDIAALADRIIATRKVKGFPPASELIAAVKNARPGASAMSVGGIPGEIFFDGEIPMIWVFDDDPRWPELCDIARKLEPVDKKGRHAKPYPMTSKYAPGVGRFFRAEHVRSVPVSDAERRIIEGLYVQAKAA